MVDSTPASPSAARYLDGLEGDALRKALLDVPADQFKEIVDADLRYTLGEAVAEALRSEPVIDRFHHQLQMMLRNVEGQLAAKQADHEQLRATALTGGQSARTTFLREQARHEKWRAGTLRFKTGLEAHMMEVRRRRNSYRHGLFESLAAEERNWALEKARRLEHAIRRHQEANGDLEPTEADMALWAEIASV